MSDDIDDIVEKALSADALAPQADFPPEPTPAEAPTKCTYEDADAFCDNGTLLNKKTLKPVIADNPAGGLAHLICPACRGVSSTPTMPEPTPDQRSCDRCKAPVNEALRRCPTCERHFCLNCTSFVDGLFCKDCLDEGKIEMKVEDGLVDSVGDHHKGRLLVPIGDAVKSPGRIISEMNDGQLEEHLLRCKNEVLRYEQGADYWRIQKAASELEKSHRQHQKIKSLRGVVIPGIGRIMATSSSSSASSGSGKSNGKAANGDPYAMLAAKLQAAGITSETLKAAIEKAKKTGGEKK